MVYDPTRTTLSDLRQWVRDCGYHCAGQSVPSHVCDPMEEPAAAEARRTAAAVEPEGRPAERMAAPHEAMGHGNHAATSMAGMAADMGNRFLVAPVFSIPVVIWSSLGESVLGRRVSTPFGLTRWPCTDCASRPPHHPNPRR